MPSSIRPAFAALWALDHAFADVVATSSDARLGAIRLAWWRERLEDMDVGQVPSEPRLQAVADALLSRGVSGLELSRLEDCWLPMLEPFPWSAAQAEGFRTRGRLLFAIGARLLAARSDAVMAAGETWSLYDGAVHCSDERSRSMLLDAARDSVGRLRPVDRAARSLTIVAALAAADLRNATRLNRGAGALRHRLTGRFPR